MEMRTALTDEDAASRYDRAGMLLDAETLGLGVTAITRGADTLFMSEQLQIKSKHYFHLRLSWIRMCSGLYWAMPCSPSNIV